MYTVTLCIIDCDGNPEHNIASDTKLSLSALRFSEIIQVPGSFNMNSVGKQTDWRFFIFSNEYATKALANALPLYLEHTSPHKFDILSLYKVRRRDYVNGEFRSCSVSPRIFRSDVEILPDMLYPVVKEYSHTAILDGMLVQDYDED